jgi:hypothetical protein
MADVALWMPWYPARYEAATKELDEVEDAIYRRALDYLWQHPEGLPRDPDRLAGCLRLRPSSLDQMRAVFANPAFFFERDGRYFNETIEEERNKAVRNREAAQRNGRKGGSPLLGVKYDIPGFVYLLRRSDGLVKIGASMNPNKRLYKVRLQIGDSLAKMAAAVEVDNMAAAETALKEAAAPYHAHGEWYTLAEDQIEALRGLIPLKGIPNPSVKEPTKGTPKGKSGGNAPEGGKLPVGKLPSAKTEEKSKSAEIPLKGIPNPPHKHITITNTKEERTLPAPGGAAPVSSANLGKPVGQVMREVWGFNPETRAEWKRFEAVFRDLVLKSKGDPEAVRTTVRRYRRAWPDIECTPEAALKHWDRMNPPPKPAPKETEAEARDRQAREAEDARWASLSPEEREAEMQEIRAGYLAALKKAGVRVPKSSRDDTFAPQPRRRS